MEELNVVTKHREALGVLEPQGLLVQLEDGVLLRQVLNVLSLGEEEDVELRDFLKPKRKLVLKKDKLDRDVLGLKRLDLSPEEIDLFLRTRELVFQ